MIDIRKRITKKEKVCFGTPGGILIRLFVLGSLLCFIIPWLIGLACVDATKWYGPAPSVARAEIRSIQRRLAYGKAEVMGKYFPEGRMFSYSFYGFCLINMALSQPDDVNFSQMVRDELERIIPIVEAIALEKPFNPNLVPKGGVIPAGHANLLRAGYTMLEGRSEDIISRFHSQSQILYEDFIKSPVRSLETYSGMIWPVDSCCALESLRLHDTLYDTQYTLACNRWDEYMEENIDKESGMMIAQLSLDGNVLDGPRGCALSWSLAFMPGFAPKLAQSQYERYRREWFVHIAGLTGIPSFEECKKDPWGNQLKYGLLDSDNFIIVISGEDGAFNTEDDTFSINGKLYWKYEIKRAKKDWGDTLTNYLNNL